MSDPLSEFNREDWKGKPYLIELRGGDSHGKRFQWHELPHMWRQPVRAPISLRPELDPLIPPVTSAGAYVDDYVPTGSVTDDGAHIYEFDRMEWPT